MLLSMSPPHHLLPLGDKVEQVPPVVGPAAPRVDLSHPGVHVGHHWYSLQVIDNVASYCL